MTATVAAPGVARPSRRRAAESRELRAQRPTLSRGPHAHGRRQCPPRQHYRQHQRHCQRQRHRPRQHRRCLAAVANNTRVCQDHRSAGHARAKPRRPACARGERKRCEADRATALELRARTGRRCSRGTVPEQLHRARRSESHRQVRGSTPMTATQSAPPAGRDDADRRRSSSRPGGAHELGARATARSLSARGATATSASAPASTGPVQSPQLPVAALPASQLLHRRRACLRALTLQDVIDVDPRDGRAGGTPGHRRRHGSRCSPPSSGRSAFTSARPPTACWRASRADTPAAAQALAGRPRRAAPVAQLARHIAAATRHRLLRAARHARSQAAARPTNRGRARASAAIDAAVESEGLRAVDELQDGLALPGSHGGARRRARLTTRKDQQP